MECEFRVPRAMLWVDRAGIGVWLEVLREWALGGTVVVCRVSGSRLYFVIECN